MQEYVFLNAVVRIHSGKLTEEERRAVMIDAAEKLYRAIQKSKGGQERDTTPCADREKGA